MKSKSEVAQSCPTISNPMDCSPPGSSIHGIFQARVLEWGAIAFSMCPLLPPIKLGTPSDDYCPGTRGYKLQTPMAGCFSNCVPAFRSRSRAWPAQGDGFPACPGAHVSHGQSVRSQMQDQPDGDHGGRGLRARLESSLHPSCCPALPTLTPATHQGGWDHRWTTSVCRVM